VAATATATATALVVGVVGVCACRRRPSARQPECHEPFAERCDAYCDAIDATANPKGSSSPCAAASQHKESERKRSTDRGSLRRAGSSRVLVSRDKVSFCLRDNYKVPAQRIVVPRRHFGRCSRNSQQGISPGWVDLYKADLSGQWLRLPANVGSDVLCLDLKADPLGRLVETDEADNATSVAFRLDGTRIRKANSRACR
jgi:hypothetical protein